VDVVIGDHTDFQVSSLRPNGVLVVENRSKGLRFLRVRMIVDTNTKQVVYKTADFHKPWTIGVTPDPAIQARIDELNDIIRPILDDVVGSSTVAIPRADVCGQTAGRTCESLIGDLTTDALRENEGTDFAITNSGGLRSNLTCPRAGGGGGFCPVSAAPDPFPITKGQVISVLPFGNFSVKATVTGPQLKQMLENGIGRMPAVEGRFPQVSGFCVTYDIDAAAGSRINAATGVVRQAANGACTGAPVDLTAGSYTVAMNDFMGVGGDGYQTSPPFAFTSNGELMATVLEEHVTAHSVLSPSIQGRIKCTDSNPAGGNVCPVGSP